MNGINKFLDNDNNISNIYNLQNELNNKLNIGDISVNSLTILHENSIPITLPTDGITDATSFIQKGLTNNSCVKLPSGTFIISSALVMSNDFTTLEGAGNDTVLYLANGSNDNMIEITGDWCSVKNIFLDGNKANQTGASNAIVCGVSATTAIYKPMINQVQIDNPYTDGIIVYGQNSSNKTSLPVISFCNIQGCGGNSINLTEWTQDAQITDTFTQTATGTGLVISGSFGHVIKGCHFYNNTIRGVLITDGGRINLTDNTIDHNQQQGILITTTSDGWSRGHVIKGNRLFSNSQGGVNTYGAIKLDSSNISLASDTTGVSNNIITNNIIYDEETAGSAPYGTIGIVNSGSDTKNNIINDNNVSADITTQYPSDSSFLTNNTIATHTGSLLNILSTTESTTKITGCCVLGGGIGVGGSSYLTNLIVDDDADFSSKKSAFSIKNSATPTSASDTGRVGSIIWDSNYLYVAVAENTWKRVAISTW